jgi:hypothetical protein
MAFSDEVQILLQKAGWHTGRNVKGRYELPVSGYPSFATAFLEAV